MTRFGFSLMCELHHPDALLHQAVGAERAGFDFVTISDHFHPWLDSHEHSAYAWSVLGGLAAITDRVGLVSLVTCPIVRYHPAIVAQKAATVAAMSGGRFTLGVGAGENLNEHVVGQGWPPVRIRHEMLEEAIEILRALWSGGYHAHRGRHFRVDDARLYTLPDAPPAVAVAASGPPSVALAARAGDALVATEPDAGLVARYREQAGGRAGATYGQLAISLDDDEATARHLAWERFRFAAGGWKVQSELPNPVNFEAATAQVREEDVAQDVSCGPDLDRHAEAIRRWADAGFDHVAIVQVGSSQDRLFEAWPDILRRI